jgi:hypothetical protein
MLYLPRGSVVISVDEVDRLAGKLIAIEDDGLGPAHAEVPEEVEHVTGLNRRIHAIHDGSVHLPSVYERTIAIPNNVEVSEVEIGSEPNFSHGDDCAGSFLGLLTKKIWFFGIVVNDLVLRIGGIETLRLRFLLLLLNRQVGMYRHAERLLVKAG